MSDATFIGIAYLGAANLFSEENKLYIGLIGGVVLISFGIYTYLKKPEILRRRSAKYKTPKAPGALTFLGKGFLMNFANPFVFFFWLAAMGFMSSHTGTEDFERIVLVFFGTTLITIFLSDVMKCYVGERFKRFLRPRIIFWINRGIGIMLMVFGVILILRVLLPL
jgi:threonine/homoserine/homoserine lactone efflux protein